jgi:hypothetical protein
MSRFLLALTALIVFIGIFLLLILPVKPKTGLSSHLTPIADQVLIKFQNLPQPSKNNLTALCKRLGGPYEDKNAELIIHSCILSTEELNDINDVSNCAQMNPGDTIGCSIVSVQQTAGTEKDLLNTAQSIEISLASGLCRQGFADSVSTNQSVINASQKVIQDAQNSNDKSTPKLQSDLATWQKVLQSSFSLTPQQISNQMKELNACSPYV